MFVYDATVTASSSPIGAGLSLLEQLAATADSRCKNAAAPILFGTNDKTGQAVVHKTNCKLWSCEQCSRRKARRVIALTLNHINTVGGQWYFGTITAHAKMRGAEASYKNLSDNFHKLRKRMREEHGGHFDYIRVWEHHDDGSFHIHFMTNCELPYTEKVNKKGERNYYCRWLKDNAAECGLGYMTDYQPLDNAGFAAHYIAKYMMKSVEDSDQWIKNMRRYQTSQGWTKLEDLHEETDFQWEYIKNAAHLWFEYHNAEANGFEVYLGTHKQRTSIKESMAFFYQVRKINQPLVSLPLYGVRPSRE